MTADAHDPALAGPLGALVTLLTGTHLRPPDLLPRAVDAAAERLGIRAVVYLVDHGQDVLVPMPGAHGVGRATLSLDSTLPGRAFRMLEMHRTDGDDGPHLWMPIIDGVERIGVLDLMADDPADLDDPVLQRRCWWLTHYLGHLVSVLDVYGDGVELVRRQQRRTIAAELIWHLLPPLTAGTDTVLVSGRLEPSADVGGDVFDYALSQDRASFAIVDATGHTLTSGLVAAAALAAYRNARREGHGLLQQAKTMDAVIGEQFGGSAYATGVLGDLDLETGRLRYVIAGHPSPLIMRHGHVVRSLDAGRRPLLGLGPQEVRVGEEQLEPEDIVVLYTDGITEARDSARLAFGLERLVDFLEREAAESTPLPEVVRRLCRRILDHQDGVLQDDATVLMLHWTTQGQAQLDPAPA